MRSEAETDYSQLEKLLYRGRWKEADEETLRVMLKVSRREKEGFLTIDHLDNFPCSALRSLDRLWFQYSRGRFGFSVQIKIYLDCGAPADGRYPGDRIWDNFLERVGWKIDGKSAIYRLHTFDISAPEGHLPSCWRWGFDPDSDRFTLGFFYARSHHCLRRS